MSVMHDHTRRLICRVLFLTVGLLPMLGVFGWAMSYHWPGTHARLENQLGQLLGLKVSFERVTYPQPGVTVYEKLTLADAEFGTPLAEIDHLQAVTGAEGLTLVAGQVNVTEPGGPAFWRWLQASLRQAQTTTWQFHAEHLRLTSAGKSHPLADFRARNNPALSGTSAVVLFRTRNGDDGAEDIQLKLARNRQANPPTTTWELRTSNSVLPVSLVQVLAPQFGRFGSEARFRGVFTVIQGDGTTPAQIELLSGCDLQGVIDQANLAELTQEIIPGALEGTVRIEIEHAQLRAGKLNSASAFITGGTGRISGMLVLAAAEALELATIAPATSEFSTSMQPYERIGIAMGVNTRGLLLRGVCENSAPGTMVGTMSGPLLRTIEPEHPLQALAGLVQIVAPQSPPQTPATVEAQQLARVLPLTGPEAKRPEH